MNSSLLIKTALRALLHHKIRSCLTMIGIISGIAAVVGTISIGRGAEDKMRREILAYGTNYVFVWSGNQNNQGVVAAGSKVKQPKPLMLDDIGSLKQQCTSIAAISPIIFDRGVITYNGINVAGELKGGNEEMMNILNRAVSLGRNFSKEESEFGGRVVILGKKVAEELFKGESPLGKLVKIKSTYFRVIGVADKIKQFGDWNDPNLASYLPLKSIRKYMQHSSSRHIHGIALSARSMDLLPRVVNEVTMILRARHHLNKKDKDDFTIIDQGSMLGAAQKNSSTFNIFLLIVASIALLVGGIGVMNIMLVSVTERTQEIGIKKALGATQRTILAQFLIESVVLCFAGGIVGICLGVAAPLAAHRFAKFPFIISPMVIVLAVITIVAIGLVFGFYPAWRAAQLNPVQALSDQ